MARSSPGQETGHRSALPPVPARRQSLPARARRRRPRRLPDRTRPHQATARHPPGPEQLLEPLAALETLDSDTRDRCGLDAETLERIRNDGFGWLPLSRVAPIARALDASLDWLVGRSLDRAATAAAGIRLDLDTLANVAKKRSLKPGQLREALDVSEGVYRRMLVNGSEQPTLAELAILANLLGTDIHSLLT